MAPDMLDLPRELPDWCFGVVQMLTMCMQIQRHKFTSSFTLEAMRDTLLWRNDRLLPRMRSSLLPRRLLFCLRPPASDFLGQPIVIVRPSALRDQSVATETLQDYLIRALEMLRQQLMRLNSDANARPKLQVLVILDMIDISVRTIVRLIFSSSLESTLNIESSRPEHRPPHMVRSRGNATFPRFTRRRCVRMSCL